MQITAVRLVDHVMGKKMPFTFLPLLLLSFLSLSSCCCWVAYLQTCHFLDGRPHPPRRWRVLEMLFKNILITSYTRDSSVSSHMWKILPPTNGCSNLAGRHITYSTISKQYWPSPMSNICYSLLGHSHPVW